MHFVSASASEDNQVITIEKGLEIRVKKLKSNRTLPHSFYDQAISSIPKLYPDHEYFGKRRSGRLGNIQYSIVCYKKSKSTNKVIVSGAALFANKAWSFESLVPESSFGDKLLIILEAIEKLPSNKSLKERSAQKHTL